MGAMEGGVDELKRLVREWMEGREDNLRKGKGG